LEKYTHDDACIIAVRVCPARSPAPPALCLSLLALWLAAHNEASEAIPAPRAAASLGLSGLAALVAAIAAVAGLDP